MIIVTHCGGDSHFTIVSQVGTCNADSATTSQVTDGAGEGLYTKAILKVLNEPIPLFKLIFNRGQAPTISFTQQV